ANRSKSVEQAPPQDPVPGGPEGVRELFPAVTSLLPSPPGCSVEMRRSAGDPPAPPAGGPPAPSGAGGEHLHTDRRPAPAHRQPGLQNLEYKRPARGSSMEDAWSERGRDGHEYTQPGNRAGAASRAPARRDRPDGRRVAGVVPRAARRGRLRGPGPAARAD